MKKQSLTGYAVQVITTCVLIALIPARSASAQTDVGCRQQQFGRFSEWSARRSIWDQSSIPSRSNLSWPKKPDKFCSGHGSWPATLSPQNTLALVRSAFSFR
jgi:hypothetical protein